MLFQGRKLIYISDSTKILRNPDSNNKIQISFEKKSLDKYNIVGYINDNNYNNIKQNNINIIIENYKNLSEKTKNTISTILEKYGIKNNNNNFLLDNITNSNISLFKELKRYKLNIN